MWHERNRIDFISGVACYCVNDDSFYFYTPKTIMNKKPEQDLLEAICLLNSVLECFKEDSSYMLLNSTIDILEDCDNYWNELITTPKVMQTRIAVCIENLQKIHDEMKGTE